MAVRFDISNVSIETRTNIKADLTIRPKITEYNKETIEDVCVFDVMNDGKEKILLTPFSYSKRLKIKPLINTEYKELNVKFVIQLNEIQKEIRAETFDILNRTNCILISLATGQGKTITAIYLATKIKFKTMILSHRINIIEQWDYSIKKACPSAKVQVLTSKTVMKDDTDFYIMNVSNVNKRDYNDYKNIGLLIVDECHVFVTENNLSCLLFFQPKYLIGLTATPRRADGMCKALDLFFGSEWIVRKMWKPFNVYEVRTNIKIPTEKNAMGKLDWNGVLEYQGSNTERNMLIVNIIRYFSTRNFLLLCKRKEQAKILYTILKDVGESVDIYIGTNKNYNIDSRILCSSFSKSGVGFSHDKLDGLIICSDVEEGIEQYLGRVFRSRDCCPIIFDFVDKGVPSLIKHYKTRKEMYESKGGVVKNFNEEFPEFEVYKNSLNIQKN